MYLIVGLGNPGKEYKKTRHNAGFMVVDALAKKLSAQFKRKQDYFLSQSKVKGVPVIIAKPRTFVNLSGIAVRKIAGYYKIKTEEILVIHDDADLSSGTLRIKRNGGSSGHNGIKSIIQELGTSDFARIRMGIGRDDRNLKDYVLSEFSPSEKKVMDETINLSLEAIFTLIEKGVEKAMLVFNKKSSTFNLQ